MVTEQAAQADVSRVEAPEVEAAPPSSPQYVTAEQLAPISEALKRIESQQRGLQGKGDKDVAALRRQLREDFRKEFGLDELRQAQTERDLEKKLALVPEDMRPYVEPLYREIQQLKTQRNPQEAPDDDPLMEQAREYVRANGYDADMPGIDYSLITTGRATVKQLAAFNKHLDQVAKASTAGVPSAATPAPRTPSPAVNVGPAATPGISTRDQLLDSMTAGRLTNDEFQKRWRSITGQDWPNGL